MEKWVKDNQNYYLKQKEHAEILAAIKAKSVKDIAAIRAKGAETLAAIKAKSEKDIADIKAKYGIKNLKKEDKSKQMLADE